MNTQPDNSTTPGAVNHGDTELMPLTVAQALRHERDDLRTHCSAAHAVLDADPSRIIRNEKDGYPEGQTPRELTLAERVAALCRYASDYARWFKDAEARAKELEKELTCIYATSESVALQEATATAANFMEMHSRAAQERDDARLALSDTAGSELLDAAREAVEAMETAQEFLRQSCGHSDCINEALAKLRQFTGKEPLP